jgi:glycosyltransferase involved in cell wall biosynthesis
VLKNLINELQGRGARATEETKSTDKYGIVVFCHLRWGFVWQRPQQFLSRFAKKHPILFIEEPFFDRKKGAQPDLQFHRVMPNVTVMCPHVGPEWNRNPDLPTKLREWTKEAIARMNQNTEGAFDRPLLWYYSPMDSAWSLGFFPNRGVVYDCMDELSQFTGAPPQLIENEKRLMQHADVIFTGGFEMGEKRKKLHDNVHIFGCGVEIEHFGKARDPETQIPADIDFMARPILGWFGVVDERVDYAMVGEMARKRPDWSFAMVGPVVKIDPNLLPHSPNLYWMGGRDYQQLPNYCAAFDICMMPFAMNASTQYINPTKGLEYMATGRPTISTPVKDVVRQWSDIISIVKNNADEFIDAAEKLLNDKTFRQEKVEKGLALASQCGWENTVKSMQQLIKDAITGPNRKSAQKIEPLTSAELQYVFQATQGS